MNRLWWAFGLVLCSCGQRALETANTNNPSYSVSYLFEYDGCRVYRFTDDKVAHYFQSCGSQKPQRPQ
ncbi:MAG: hypothetical protein C5B49_01935 [Bdellovibrio sp.]|nr:MAG: hypothetical protein C5B49_01935 [Bdellovibrio sp.]